MRNKLLFICTVATLVGAAHFIACSPDRSHPVAGKDTISHADSTGPLQTSEVRDSSTYEQRQGKFLYVKYCDVCHGEQGKGDGFNAYNLNPKPRDFTDAVAMKPLTDERIAETISGGGRSVNKSPLMPSWGGTISKQQIGYLVSYIRTFMQTASIKE